MEPRIALLDIETAPLQGFAWQVFSRHGGRHIIEEIKPGYILCFCVQWLGEKKIHTYTLADFPRFATDKQDDKDLVGKLHEVLDAADICVAHNAAFDLRWATARFIFHGLKPTSPYQVADTLKMARKHMFSSNRLDDLGKHLSCGRKLPHTGKALWLGCMAGDRKSFALMGRYCRQDVALLHEVYLRLRPFSVHPNLNHYTRKDGCPVCQSDSTRAYGWRYLKSGRRQRYVCRPCGHRFDAGPLVK